MENWLSAAIGANLVALNFWIIKEYLKGRKTEGGDKSEGLAVHKALCVERCKVQENINSQNQKEIDELRVDARDEMRKVQGTLGEMQKELTKVTTLLGTLIHEKEL